MDWVSKPVNCTCGDGVDGAKGEKVDAEVGSQSDTATESDANQNTAFVSATEKDQHTTELHIRLRHIQTSIKPHRNSLTHTNPHSTTLNYTNYTY